MRVSSLAALVVLLGGAAFAAAPQDGSNNLPVKFTAFAVNLGGPRTNAGTAQVDITIDRWSTDPERERLIEALKTGQDALLDTLRDLQPSARSARQRAWDTTSTTRTRLQATLAAAASSWRQIVRLASGRR